MKIQHPFRTALIATLGVGVGLLLIGGVQTLSTILLYVGTALFLSLGLDPVISWLQRRRLPRWAAVLIVLLALLILLAGVMLLIVPIIAQQIGQLVKAIAKVVDSGTFLPDIEDWVTGIFPGVDIGEITAYVQDWLSSLDYASIGGGLIAVGATIIGGLAGTFIVIILTIYFTAAVPNLKKAVYQLVPASKRPRFVELSEQITDSVGYFVMGQVSLGVINGILSAIFLSIIGAPFPAVLAVVAFLFSIIPLVGTLTGSTLIVLTCFIPGLGSPTIGIIAAVYYLIYMQVEAYVISPRIMGRAVAVPGAVVVISALAGGALLGILGALVAIPIAASILILYRQVVIPRQNER
ncbi:MAG: AI-2E family transporter [Microbacterium sp.]